MNDPRLPPNLKLGVQLRPGEPIVDLFSLIDVPHRHDKDKWMAFFGTPLDFVGIATLGAAKDPSVMPRWRVQSDVGADYFQARLLDFTNGQIVVSLVGFRWAEKTFQLPTPANSTFGERLRNRRKADLDDPKHKRMLES